MTDVRAELLVNNKVISESVVPSLSQRCIKLEHRLYESLMSVIRFFHQSHNTVHFGGLFTLNNGYCLKHDRVPRENKLYCFYVKNPPKRIALWDRENSQW